MQPPATFVPPDDLEPTRKFPMAARTKAKALIHLFKKHPVRQAVELGAGDGRTAATVMAKCLWLRMTCVDCWEPQPGNTGPETWAHWPNRLNELAARNRMASFGRRGRVMRAWSVAATERFEDGSLDAVIFDADKSRYALSADIAAWTPKIRKGGLLLGCEAHWPSVQATLADLLPEHWIVQELIG